MKIFFPHCAFESCLLRAIFIFCKSGAKLMFFPTVPPLFVQIDLAPTILLDVHYVYYEQKISFPNMLEISIYECSIQGHAKHTVGKKNCQHYVRFFQLGNFKCVERCYNLTSVLPTTLLAIIAQVGNTGRHFRFQTNLFSPK